MIHTLEKMAEHKIMSKRFLRNLKMEKKDMIKLLSSAGWRRRLTELAREKDFTAAGMVQAVEPVLDKLADPPEGGWIHPGLQRMCLLTVLSSFWRGRQLFLRRTDRGGSISGDPRLRRAGHDLS